ncbi:MAG: AAA family ATPase [Chloroflexi bacterium]|nr:AAA family ATPase [Chloroflexota bacterium]
MSFSIAVAGKGGTGKTSMTSLIIRYLRNNKRQPILAIDADPNANLGESLGLEVKQTVGSMVASFQGEKMNIPPGITKDVYLEYKLNSVLVEGRGIDLLTMGRGEGPECYCVPNHLLKKFADSLAQNYAYVVMDNEAGMEHLSRKTTENIDELFFVSDHSIKGVRTIARLKELVSELKLRVKSQSVIINRVPDGIDPHISEELARLGIEPAALIPEDELVAKYDLEVKPLLDLPDTSKAVQAVGKLLDRLLKT